MLSRFLWSSDFRLDMVEVLRTEAASLCFSLVGFVEGMVLYVVCFGSLVNFGVGRECRRDARRESVTDAYDIHYCLIYADGLARKCQC